MKKFWIDHKDGGCQYCGVSLPSYSTEVRQVHHLNECKTITEYKNVNVNTAVVLCRACHLMEHYPILKQIPIQELVRLIIKYDA